MRRMTGENFGGKIAEKIWRRQRYVIVMVAVYVFIFEEGAKVRSAENRSEHFPGDIKKLYPHQLVPF